jgi:hypothetical protein
MSYTFTAAPKVIRSKKKFRSQNVKDIMEYSPLELEKMYV